MEGRFILVEVFRRLKLDTHYPTFVVRFPSDLPFLCSARACQIAYKLKVFRFDLILYGFGKSKGKNLQKIV